MAANLELIRSQRNLPALSAGYFRCDGLAESATVGLRRRGSNVLATIEDRWHLGSNTKTITAFLVGKFVAEGRLSWHTRIYPHFEAGYKVSEDREKITIEDLLTHKGGIIENLPREVIKKAYDSVPTLSDGRKDRVVARYWASNMALTAPPYDVGTFRYGNCSFMILGSLLEKLSGRSWETLIQTEVFDQFGMASSGFGGLGTPGLVDQPWPHREDGVPANSNGSAMDNTPLIWPAAAIHASLKDWSKFLIDQLRGARGRPGLLPSSIYEAMQTPDKNNLGYGWQISARGWAGGNALFKGGSNTLNTSLTWIAPKRDFGVMACTNQGGKEAFIGCDQAVTFLIKTFLK